MKVSSDFSELLLALNEAEAKYLIVGGYAVAWYAEPRFTKDLDLWTGADPENAERVHSALNKFGAPLANVSVDDLCTPGTVFQIGVPPNRVDILTEISSVDFDEAWKERVEGTFGSQKTWFIALEGLIKNKRAVARPQDLRDVRTLEKRKIK